tara:strand:- start:2103 stop:3272 length:1170 start_codon:yes stop_codon:yes gene_type:complete
MAYQGDYQGLHAKPSFYVSYANYLWGNDFKANYGDNDRYPLIRVGSLFDYDNSDTDIQSVLSMQHNNQIRLSPNANGNNTLDIWLAAWYHSDFYKLADDNMMFDHVIILGHNMSSGGYKFKLDTGGNSDTQYQSYTQEVVHNGTNADGFYTYPQFDGMTIVKIINTPAQTGSNGHNHRAIRFRFDPANESYNGDLRIGAIILAKKYTMETTPIKNYSVQFVNNFTKNTSYNGISRSNTMSPYSSFLSLRNYTNLQGLEGYKSRIMTGFRKWSLAFNVLHNDESAHGMFPVNEAANNFPQTGGYTDDTDNIYDDYPDGIPEDKGQIWNNNDFTSRVWNMTNGFSEPFIFHQSQTSDPDQYAIARIEKNTFQSSQVAHNIFDLKLNITEQT